MRERIADVGPQQAQQLTVTLRDVQPPVWRRLVVPSSFTLEQSHEVLQVAMGWQNAHLYQFVVAGTRYTDDDDDFDDEPVGDPRTFTLADARRVTSAFEYEYDFGDGWTHDVQLGLSAESGPVVPHVVDGARACPPEDCGGPGGYEELLSVLGGTHDEEYDELQEWLGRDFDPEAFDVDAVNAQLMRSRVATRRTPREGGRPRG